MDGADWLAVMVIGALVLLVCRRQRGPRLRPDTSDEHLLPYEDLPPIGAFTPVPDDIDAYIADGIEAVDKFVAGDRP